MPKSPPETPAADLSWPARLPPHGLKPRGDNRFVLTPPAAQRAELAASLGLLALRKLRLSGTLRAEGSDGWRLDATLGATVTQPCVITAEPVTTRIDAPVTRLFLRDFTETTEEAEFDGDDEAEPLGEAIDLSHVLTEALALALPDYPRLPGAELGEARIAPPGSAPLRDEEVKPFAGLARLRDKLKE